jgi:hypothetical protein
MDPARRKALGAWYTPPALVRHLVAEGLAPVLAGHATVATVRVCDPACGDGRVLVAAAEHLADHFAVPFEVAARSCHGADVDPDAAAQTAAALGPGATVRCLDALTGPWEDASFDAVLTNPPFLGQLTTATSRGGRSPLGGGPYADAAVVFLALALRLVRPERGTVAIVLPQSVLTARDAAPIRRGANEHAPLASLWSLGERVFVAGVLVCVATFESGGRRGPVRRWRGAERLPLPDAPAPTGAAGWGGLIADVDGAPLPLLGALATTGTLGRIATAAAGFRRHYYGLVPHVHEAAELGAVPPQCAPLITAGLVDRGDCGWGQRPARFAKQLWSSPVVDLDGVRAASPELSLWIDRQLVPKVVVATQTRVLEAAVDTEGRWIASVPTIAVAPRRPDDLWPVAALLLSPVASLWALAQWSGSGMGVATIRPNAAGLGAVPLPTGDLTAAAGALAAGALAEATDRAARAYALSPVDHEALMSWWEGMVSRAGG